ncbi:MAG: hypothetical protein KAR40_05975 [Candidatus Sabulitectum sp.]|nr:hypothetical protein [Candidatus Sabulitectum sp.]
MTDMFADFKKDEAPANADMAKLESLVDDLLDARRAVDDAEKALKAAKKVHQQLEEFDLPTHMVDVLGLGEVTTRKGIKVSIKKQIRASIGNRQAQAYPWLVENGYTNLIKRTVLVAFNPDQGEEAHELADDLADRFAGVKEDMKVEAATLTAWVKKQMAAGVEIPQDIFGVFEQRKAVVKV